MDMISTRRSRYTQELAYSSSTTITRPGVLLSNRGHVDVQVVEADNLLR